MEKKYSLDCQQKIKNYLYYTNGKEIFFATSERKKEIQRMQERKTKTDRLISVQRIRGTQFLTSSPTIAVIVISIFCNQIS
jgi:hypothetical protein